MLADLVAYYSQLVQNHPDEIPPIGWSYENVTYILQISPSGFVNALIPITDNNAKRLIVPERSEHTSNIAASFLCDNAEYVLGLGDERKSGHAAKCFKAAAALHHDVLDKIDSLCGNAILSYYDNGILRESNLALNCGKNQQPINGNIIFQIKTETGVFNPLDDERIIRAWNEYVTSSEKEQPMRCLVSGAITPITRKHPSIKGVYGAKSKAKLVSFDKDSRAFASYGHDGEQGRNAPVGERSAKAYAIALNYLLSDRNHHTRLGDTTMVYWSDRKDAQNTKVFSFAMGGTLLDDTSTKANTDDVVDETMKAISNGRYRSLDGVDLDATFFVLGLAPSGARLSVKFYYKDSFGKMLNNLSKHYRRCDIAHSRNERVCLTPYQLLKDIEHPKAKKPVVTPLLNGPLLKSMLEDTPYPYALYTHTLQRIHATKEDKDNKTRKVTRARASIIRAYLIKNCSKNGYSEEELTVELNEERNEKAYCLGRAFAILEWIQETANGKATITNRYFNAASTTPLAVFPSIIQLSGAHLTKIGRTQPGYAIYLRKQLFEVLGKEKVDAFPKRLSLEEQGDFILGYVHQTNARYTNKTETNDSSVDNEEE